MRLLADNLPPAGALPTLEEQMTQAYQNDPLALEIFEALRIGAQRNRTLSLVDCRSVNNKLFYQDRLYVPDNAELRLRIIQGSHDTPVAGHPGRERTFELLTRKYFWPSMRKDVERFVANCHTCRRTKPRRHASHGTLLPLPVPDRPWQDISMDFVVGLPKSKGFDAIWVVVDRLSKQRHFVPFMTTIDAQGQSTLFIDNIFRLHGLPDSIVRHRGPQFVADFWRYLCASLGIAT